MTSEQHRRQPRPSIPKESGLIQRARGFLRDHFREQVPHLVVGYSGGKDSLALLLVLDDLRRLGRCRLTVVHVDHALRDDSGNDAARAVEVGDRLGLSVTVRRPERPVMELFPGRGVEDAARSYRYRALAWVAEESGADAIAVAHHAGDQAETVLLHLLRGSGLGGLAGMASDTMLPVPGGVPGDEVRVVRPFLHESPEALVKLVAESGVPVIEDPTNAGREFRRNRIRHDLLPLMEQIAPGATGRVVSLADLVREDATAIEMVASSALREATIGDSLVWTSLRRAPAGVQRRVVRLWLQGNTEVEHLTRDRVDAVIAVANRGVSGRVVDLGDGWRVRYVREQINILPPGRDG